MRTNPLLVVLSLATLLFSCGRGEGAAKRPRGRGPLRGQIIVDPDHPQRLKRRGGVPFFMCGPGDPEGFLYRGKRRPDGTRDGNHSWARPAGIGEELAVYIRPASR